ncbi:DUF6651 domain-containing protein [Cupriavidus metallidurans]|uniref:DUF6651 domain-containing protein n=1 Tax=Cupriavidus metallidurans TaxID=119219 RepID=UPI001CCB0F79|nr:DUF6651 domain-containing protein [Cupriavidus metallidurans]UBM12766.1 hypothetical protein LAI70_27830 [Cupriavidus metallidurans]
MTQIQRLMRLHRLMDQAPAGEAAGGGGDGGGGDGSTAPKGKGEGEGDKTTGDKGGGDGGGDGDGKTKPTDSEAKLLREVMEKKAANKDLQEQLKRFEGIDPEAARAALAAESARKQKELEERGEFEAVKKQMADAHTADLAQRDQVITGKDAENAALKARIADMTVGADFSGSKFITDELALTPRKARTVYGSHFDYSEELGRVVGHDKPAGAKDRAPLVDAKGEPLTFDEALRKLVDADPDRDDILKAKAKPGAASSTTTTVRPVQGESQNEATGVGRISAALKAQKK